MKTVLLAVIFAIICSLPGAAEPGLNPDYPVVEGKTTIGDEWFLYLPEPFNQRSEEEGIVFWKPGFTIWMVLWNNDKELRPRNLLADIKKIKSKNAYGIVEKEEKNLYRYGYRLDEKRDGGKKTVYAFYGFVAGNSGYVQIAFYFDAKSMFETAKQIWLSVLYLAN
ncbi:MAG: hypothetical protein JW969_16815 [Spirochaetales bacterium]|nr:hypothetical protein [Spirochaetales bacterium]